MTDDKLMKGAEFEIGFLEFLIGTTARTKHLADRAMIQFVALRLLMVFTSALLPALATRDDRLWVTGAAILVAVLTGLDTQFRWGEEWKHFRSTQMTLERLRREYEFRKLSIQCGRVIGNVKTDEDNFEKLYSDVEILLQSEADRFFKFRITEWRRA
ncbi:MAG: DUF4231 domain-containing protein [Ancalomicrobiaceae bacterium]|nr:DUF4231 domain-containing protein [Ancalomicrobiaceae bacterium]